MRQVSSKIKKGWLIAPLLLAIALISSQYFASAATGHLYFDPATTSVGVGNNIIITLRVDPQTTIFGVDATITFDPSKLQYVGIDESGTPFNFGLSPTVGSGSIAISRLYAADPPTGVTTDSVLVKITFKALVGSGTTDIGLRDAAMYMSDTSTVAPTTAQSSLTLTGDVPAATATPTVAVTATPTPEPDTVTDDTNTDTTTDPTPTPTPDPAKPTISAQPTTIEFTKTSLTVTSTVPVKAWIKYGHSGVLSLTTATTELGTSHLIALDDAALVAGTSYQYVVVAQDTAGNILEGEQQSFRTKGYTVKVAIKGMDGKPLKGKDVTLHSDPLVAKTDSKGIVIFNDVAPGAHTVEYTEAGKTYSQAITVEDNKSTDLSGTQTARPQSLAISYDDLTVKDSISMQVALGLVAVIGAAAIIAYIMARRGSHRHGLSTGVSAPNVAAQKPTDDLVTTTITPTTAPSVAQPSERSAESVTEHNKKPEPEASKSTTVDNIHTPTPVVPGTVITPTEIKPAQPDHQDTKA